MAKINFTKEHLDKMMLLSVEMLMKNEVVTSKLGTVLNIVELLHTTTINTLNNIRLDLNKKIESIENQDEWIATDSNQAKLSTLKKHKELVNLIIGYKRYLDEQESIRVERERLTKELDNLKESQKSPQEKIKEIEDKLSSLS